MAGERSLGDRKRKNMAKKKKVHVAEREVETYSATMENIKKKQKSSADIDKKSKTKTIIYGVSNSIDEMHGPIGGSGKAKKLNRKRDRSAKLSDKLLESRNDECNTSVGDGVTTESAAHNLPRRRKKKRKGGKLVTTVENESEQQYEKLTSSAETEAHYLEKPENTKSRRSSKLGKSKKSGKTKKKNLSPVHEPPPKNSLGRREDEEDEVYKMSSGDEDNSKGMKKWMTQYYKGRPGLKVLEERIDDFIMAHEAQEAKARAEREAEAAEGGWTVVVHHKGRKKTTETESGVSVSSAAEAAILDKISQKKKNDVGLDFYRFQKREAHRNEIMMLQSKFEQDKKRIQEMRAARKFRPY